MSEKTINGIIYELYDDLTASVVGYDSSPECLYKTKLIIKPKICYGSSSYLVTRIDDHAFCYVNPEGKYYGNENLRAICIPCTISNLGSEVFAYCHNLDSIINYGDTAAQIQDDTFDYMQETGEITYYGIIDVVIDNESVVDSRGIAHLRDYYDKPESHENFDMIWN